MARIRTIQGDCRDVLRSLPDESVHCCVTSPPYWGLRDYGVAGQIGLEPTMEQFGAEMVGVFREVRRVLRKDGTLWLNLGDSYATGTSSGRKATQTATHGYWENGAISHRIDGATDGLKPKDLCGIPWRVAFALQAEGWWLRQDIVWAKPNPMPESVTDRCTKAHEYVFMLTKSDRYYYDNNAIREPYSEASIGRFTYQLQASTSPGRHKPDSKDARHKETHIREPNAAGRNKRSVWEVATAPFAEAHFATFPPALIEPCILAGTSEKGCCSKCGAPWVRETERTPAAVKSPASDYGHGAGRNDGGRSQLVGAGSKTLGWSPSCQCNAPTVPCTVLDPFGGAGTTGLVADRLQRNAILIELNPAYAAMAEKRIHNDAPLFARSPEAAE
jgi:DNA modification methylase